MDAAVKAFQDAARKGSYLMNTPVVRVVPIQGDG